MVVEYLTSPDDISQLRCSFPLQNKRHTGTEDAAATAGPGTKTLHVEVSFRRHLVHGKLLHWWCEVAAKVVGDLRSRVLLFVTQESINFDQKGDRNLQLRLEQLLRSNGIPVPEDKLLYLRELWSRYVYILEAHEIWIDWIPLMIKVNKAITSRENKQDASCKQMI